MGPSPVHTPHHPVWVEYDRRGQRASQRFDNPYAARSFYVRQFRAGKNPAVRGAGPSPSPSPNQSPNH